MDSLRTQAFSIIVFRRVLLCYVLLLALGQDSLVKCSNEITEVNSTVSSARKETAVQRLANTTALIKRPVAFSLIYGIHAPSVFAVGSHSTAVLCRAVSTQPLLDLLKVTCRRLRHQAYRHTLSSTVQYRHDGAAVTTARIILKQTTMRMRRHNITCFCETKGGAKSKKTVIFFLEDKPLPTEAAPKSSPLYRKLVVHRRHSISLRWRFPSENLESITCLHDGVPLDSVVVSGRKGIVEVFINGTTSADAGIYSCQSKTSENHTEWNQILELHVLEGWSAWRVWIPCSTKCGIGTAVMRRTCLNTDHTPCQGNHIKVEQCVATCSEQSSPQFMQHPKNIRVKTGTPATFHCAAQHIHAFELRFRCRRIHGVWISDTARVIKSVFPVAIGNGTFKRATLILLGPKRLHLNMAVACHCEAVAWGVTVKSKVAHAIFASNKSESSKDNHGIITFDEHKRARYKLFTGRQVNTDLLKTPTISVVFPWEEAPTQPRPTIRTGNLTQVISLCNDNGCNVGKEEDDKPKPKETNQLATITGTVGAIIGVLCLTLCSISVFALLRCRKSRSSTRCRLPICGDTLPMIDQAYTSYYGPRSSTLETTVDVLYSEKYEEYSIPKSTCDSNNKTNDALLTEEQTFSSVILLSSCISATSVIRLDNIETEVCLKSAQPGKQTSDDVIRDMEPDDSCPTSDQPCSSHGVRWRMTPHETIEISMDDTSVHTEGGNNILYSDSGRGTSTSTTETASQRLSGTSDSAMSSEVFEDEKWNFCVDIPPIPDRGLNIKMQLPSRESDENFSVFSDDVIAGKEEEEEEMEVEEEEEGRSSLQLTLESDQNFCVLSDDDTFYIEEEDLVGALDDTIWHRGGSNKSNKSTISGMSSISKSSCPRPVLPDTADQTLCAWGLIDHRGGFLYIANTGISLYIPALALPEGQEVVVFIALMNSKGQYPDLMPGQAVLGPAVVCGPDGLEFNKPVYLTVPHNAVIEDNGIPKLTGKSCPTVPAGSKPSWNIMKGPVDDDDVDEHDMEGCGPFSYVDDTSLQMMITHFTNFVPIGEPKKLKTKVVSFSTPPTAESDCSVRIYCIAATDAALEVVRLAEEHVHGIQVDASKLLYISYPSRDVHVTAVHAMDGWDCVTDADQTIPFHDIWNGIQESPNVSFGFARTKPNEFNFRYKFEVQQLGESAVVKIYVAHHIKRLPSTLSSGYESIESGLVVPQRIIPEWALKELRIKLEPTDNPCTGNWKDLAEKLGMESSMVRFLDKGKTIAPTDELFAWWEVHLSDKVPLPKLAEYLEGIGRADAARVVERLYSTEV